MAFVHPRSRRIKMGPPISDYWLVLTSTIATHGVPGCRYINVCAAARELIVAIEHAVTTMGDRRPFS